MKDEYVETEARRPPESDKFLWEHWSRKRPRRVVVTFYFLKGDLTTHNLYVGPVEDGRWRVVSKYENECCWFYSLEKPKRERRKGVDIYNTVERAEKREKKIRRGRLLSSEALPDIKFEVHH